MITIPDGIPIVLNMSSDTIICLDGTATISASASGGTQPLIIGLVYMEMDLIKYHLHILSIIKLM